MNLPFVKKPNFSKLAHVFAEHAFLFFLGFVSLVFIASVAFFLLFIWFPQQETPEDLQARTQFNEEDFQSLVDLQQDRQQVRQQSVEGRNPFLIPFTAPTEEELPSEQ